MGIYYPYDYIFSVYYQNIYEKEIMKKYQFLIIIILAVMIIGGIVMQETSFKLEGISLAILGFILLILYNKKR